MEASLDVREPAFLCQILSNLARKCWDKTVAFTLKIALQFLRAAVDREKGSILDRIVAERIGEQQTREVSRRMMNY
ncbi:hypothetical protein HYV22_01000 [Candidatus Gottesmanbacteria bacterium]|nr:hypothetical protein [Candidatus Gottesmanbacteria bacterium]